MISAHDAYNIVIKLGSDIDLVYKSSHYKSLVQWVGYQLNHMVK